MHPATTSADLHERIRRRAEEIYFQGGCIPGRDLQNWALAENEIFASIHNVPTYPRLFPDRVVSRLLLEAKNIDAMLGQSGVL